MTDVEWSPWVSVSIASSWKESAVYRFRLLASGKPASIPRFLRPDSEGILSIGVSGNMDRRRARFIRGYSKGRGHSEANLLHILNKLSTSASIPLDQIEYSYSICPNRAVALSLEERLLKQYFLAYGEVPPLNSAIPGRYESTGWGIPEPPTKHGAA